MKGTLSRIAPIFLLALSICPVSLHAEWVKDGVAICPSLGDQWYSHITSDSEGGAIITWYEVRSGVPYDFDIYAQRIDGGGNILWTQNGVPICTASGAQADPQITPDGGGGAIISWRDERSGTFHIYAQRIDANGNVQWTTNGVAITSERYGQYTPSVILDGHGNFFITWRDDHSGVGQVYCQKLDGNGNALWAVNGIAVCPTSYWQDDPHLLSDKAGGAIVVWEDERYSILNSFIYAQRIDGNGNKLWATSGVPITLSSNLKWNLCCIEDGCAGGFVSWSNGDTGSRNVFAQRIDSTGAIWTGGDVPICTVAQDQYSPGMALDGSGGAFIAWDDWRDGGDCVYAQRISGAGDIIWASNGIPIRINAPTAIEPWTHPELIPDGAGGAIIVWKWGDETATYDIFAQRVDPDGNLLWLDTSVVVCGAVGEQNFPQMISNEEGGAIITWRDMRQDTIGAVYAMRVTANGETVATLLQSWAASIEGSRVLIEWHLSEIDAGVRFLVLRSDASNGSYQELTSAQVERQGLSFSCTDETCEAGHSYRYRVDMEVDGSRKTLFETEVVTLPRIELALLQNYPNPFNPSTMIEYRLPEKAQVRIEIYDTAGRRVACVMDGEQGAGPHSVMWDGKDATGRAVSSGVYFYRLTAGRKTISRKMVLLK
jgi:hypothetical protein